MLNKNASLEVHDTWQEAVGIALGLIASLSPFLAGETNPMILNATTAAGALVLVLSAVKLLSLNRYEEFAILLCGLWLCAGPTVLGYAGTPLGLMHWLAGPVIVAMSVLEIWQDWRLTDDELERHGA
jgi:hypothetical protein